MPGLAKKMPEMIVNDFNTITIYESIYIVYTYAFGYHEM